LIHPGNDIQEGYSLLFVLDVTAAWDVSKPGISMHLILSELQAAGSRPQMLRWGCRNGARSCSWG